MTLVFAVPVKYVPVHTPGAVAASEEPKIELKAVVGADAPIVTFVAVAETVRQKVIKTPRTNDLVFMLDIF
jgi:hypothetical protein